MQKEVRLTDDEWTVVMKALHAATYQVDDNEDAAKQQAVQHRILTQLRCHEAMQTMAPACSTEGGENGS